MCKPSVGLPQFRTVGLAVALVAFLMGFFGCTSPSSIDGDRFENRLRELESRVDLLDGGDLLRRWPPPEWGKERLEEILKRETVSGVYRNEEESEFIKNFEAWTKALERRNAAARNAKD